MGRIMGGFERALISALEPIVVSPAQGRLESFARHILETTTAHPVQTRPAQRLAVAAPVTDAQPAILPQLARRAEALWRVDVCTEDRKSTRLNSSHVEISYAVFCLK